MSVDFNACEICGNSIYEENCYERPIDDTIICVCKWCLSDEIKNGNLLAYDEESDDYDTLTDEEKELIDDYGTFYKRTQSGVIDRISEIDEQIKSLLEEKQKLIQKQTK